MMKNLSVTLMVFSMYSPLEIFCMPLMSDILGLFVFERLCLTVLRSSAASLSEPHLSHTNTNATNRGLEKGC